MQQAFAASIIQVLDLTGRVVGTGFLAADRLAVTCAHVIHAAKSRLDAMVYVQFLCDAAREPVLALVIFDRWSPELEEDVAFLRLQSMPGCAQPARLAYARASGGHSCLAIGRPLPIAPGFSQAHGVILGLEEDLRGRSLLTIQGEEFEPGMSGGPLLDVTLGRVVGMLAQDPGAQYPRGARATPLEALERICPELHVDDPQALLAPPEAAAPTAAAPAKPAQPPLLAGELPEPGALPPGARLPFPRSDLFTGRVQDLLALLEGLAPGGGSTGGPQPFALSGPGGIGKTQAAVEFCYRCGRWFAGVHWVAAGNVDDIGAEIAACGAAMGLADWPDRPEEQVEATLRAWASAPERLVVLDSLRDPEALRAWLPRLGGVHLLITTRGMDWPSELNVTIHPLDVFTRAESRALLHRLAPRLERAVDAELDLLAARLGDLPLSLNLAGRYLEDAKNVPLATYLGELDRAGPAPARSPLKDRAPGGPPRHTASLEAIFARTWQRLAGEGTTERLARMIFQAAGYCAPDVPIPERLLWKAAADQELTRLDFERALHRLDELGLLSAAGRGQVIHPLLAEFAHGLEDSEHQSLERLSSALALSERVAGEVDLPAQDFPMLAHYEEVAPSAEAAGVASAGALWSSLGDTMRMSAEYERAKEFCERALRLNEQIYGPDHPQVAVNFNNLGLVMQQQGDLAGARACYDRALHIAEGAFGPEHAMVAAISSSLGSVLNEQGDLAGARTCYERALHIHEQVSGPDHPDVAAAANTLGRVLRSLGDLEASGAFYERALRIDEQQYRPPPANTAGSEPTSAPPDPADLAGAKAHFRRALHVYHQYRPEDDDATRGGPQEGEKRLDEET